MDSSISILFLGDVVGKPGRRAVTKYLKDEARPHADVIIVNVENCAHGFGVTEANVKELHAAGVQVMTGGNHTFDRREIFNFIDNYPFVVRPGNYPVATAGSGIYVHTAGDTKVAVINLLGRVFMEPLRSPFEIADELIAKAQESTNIIFLDFHAEATAEKVALAHYVDGRISCMVGTHTHIQTADERVLPKGMAYITDAGCCAPIHSVIGMDYEAVYRRLIEQMPARFEVAAGPALATGVFVKVDKASGKALSIERVRYEETDVALDFK